MSIARFADVLIVDDHPLYRDGVVHMLAQRVPHCACRVARDGASALEAMRQSQGCDLVIADHRLPGDLDGLTLLTHVAQRYPTAARVLTSGSDDVRLAQQARRHGFMGYLPKALDPELWIEALKSILEGEPWFPSTAKPAGGGLTPRQISILERIAAGQTNKVIARDLGVTERTIKYHLQETFDRTQAASRAEAVARALALGWISPSSNLS